MLMALFFANRAERLIKAAAEVRSQVVGYLVDILNNMMSVRLFAARHYESQKLRKQLDQNVLASQNRDWYFVWVSLIQAVSFAIYQALSLLVLIYSFKQGQVSAGDFVLILTVNISIVQVLRSFSEDISRTAELIGNINQGVTAFFKRSVLI